MHQLIIAIIVIVAIYLAWRCTKKDTPRKESMTRIRRTVGTINTGDETPTAAGVISSMPIMDMTHTYGRGTSCDECPNAESCPECPQYKTHEGFTGAPRPDTTLPEYIDGAPTMCGSDALATDLDAEFTRSREAMGANTSKQFSTHPLSGGRSAIHAAGEELGSVGDDVRFDGDRAVTLGRKACKPSDASAIRLLYTDVMGLDPHTRTTADDCEYTNSTGYVYKEPC